MTQKEHNKLKQSDGQQVGRRCSKRYSSMKTIPRILAAVLFLTSATVVFATSEEIVLSSSSIGNMPISPGKEISLHMISLHFSGYRVTHEIGEGDSPDFHLFTVSTYEGDNMFFFVSYVRDPSEYVKGKVKLDEVVVLSSLIVDEFGISPGMSVKEALKLRKDLDFGAGHMDNYLGKDQLWYLFRVNDYHGTQVTREMAMEADPKVDAISWPHPKWR